MSVTQYTIGCGYELLKLKDTVFFLSKNSLKTITIDNGEAYATFVNQSPQPPSPNRLKGFNVKLTETESLDERYKFTKQLTMSITGHLTDSQFLIDDDFYIVVQTEDGTYYLVNVDFPSKMTYTYNLSEGQNQTDFTFTSNSNYTTLKLNWSPTTWNTCQTYQLHGIDSLRLLEKAYTSIDGNGVINLFDGNEFKDVDFLKNTATLQEVYDGEVITTTISFEIPFNNYKPSWQYNLLEFDKNLYAAHITPKNSTSGIFAGYEHGLQPSYELNGSATVGDSTSIKITLTEASEWGLFEFNTWSYYRTSAKKWIGVDSEVKCLELGLGVNSLLQEVDENGTPTGRYKCLEGYESVYTDYNIIGTYTEDEVESFKTSKCTRFRTRGGIETTYYTCINGDKYELYANQVSYDAGKHWIDDDSYTIGNLIEVGSTDCEIEPQYEWRLSEMWDCLPPLERWIPSGYTCINGDKYQNNYMQVSNDGTNWVNSNPLVWSASTLIEYGSDDCDDVIINWQDTTATTCSGTDKVFVANKYVSYDNGVSWAEVVPTVTGYGSVYESESIECGAVIPAPPEGEVYKFYGINQNGGVIELEYDATGSSCSPTDIVYYNITELFFCRHDDNKYMYFGDYLVSTVQWVTGEYDKTTTNVKYIKFNDILQSFEKTFNGGDITSITFPNLLGGANCRIISLPNLRTITFPETINSITLGISDYDVTMGVIVHKNGYAPNLKKLVIPKDVTHFGGLPLRNYGYGSVEEIYFEGRIPPQILDDDRYRISSALTTRLYVPSESVELYKKAWGKWFADESMKNLIIGYHCTADTAVYNDTFKYKITTNGRTTVVPKGDANVNLEITSTSELSGTTKIVIGDSVKSVTITNGYGNPHISLYLGSNVKNLSVTSWIGGVTIMNQLPEGIRTINLQGAKLHNDYKPSSLISEAFLARDLIHYTSGTNTKIVDVQCIYLDDTNTVKSVTLGDSVQVLKGFQGYSSDSYHHTGCTSITSVTIGNSLGFIQPNAFLNATGLTSVTITATTPPLGGNDAFCGTGCPIYVPASAVNAYKTAWNLHASRIQPIT